ncbi:MAG: PQQ-binding-like beta-propeller repeat protein [Verrucomicrobia bacterium]|nr:PQQ-binding-like beta-propeller repeat protein [Verrucomicrobiota bacterium]
MTYSKQPTTRWWPLISIWILALGAGIYFALTSDINRQGLIMKSIGAGIVAGALSVMWLLALSRLPWGIRLKGFFGVVLLGVACISLFRYEGVSGDLFPIIKWRWSAAAEKVATGIVDSSDLVDGSYPQFLGPNRDTTITGVTLDPEWNRKPPRLIWKQPIGEAWSAFAISGNRAITQEQDGEDELVVCYELLTGNVFWEHRYPARFDNPLGGIGPRATPTIDEHRVFTLGALGDLFCLDLETGEKLWGHNVLEKHGASLPDWGMAGSPLVYGDFLIVSVGGSGGHSLVAYDKTTGDNFWRGGSGAAHWSSPVLYDIAGKKQVLIFNKKALVAHDVSNGKILWEYPWLTDGMPHVAIPVLVPGDRVILSSAYGKGAAMLQISPGEKKQKVKRLWKTLHLKAKFNNYVFKDGYIYGLDDGMLTCIDVEKGRRTWKKGRYGHGQNILVGDLMLLTTEQGEVLLLEPVPEEPRILGSFQALKGKSWNPPALVGEYLLLRNHLEAALYRLPLLEE